MTRKQIEYELGVQRGRRDYAKHQLDLFYQDMEDRGEEMYWLSLYIKHKRAVETLEKEVPDD